MIRSKITIYIFIGVLLILLVTIGAFMHLRGANVKNEEIKTKVESDPNFENIDFLDFSFNNSVYTNDVCESITSITVHKDGKNILIEDQALCEQLLKCLASAEIGDEIKDVDVFGFYFLDFCIDGITVSASLNENIISFDGTFYELKDNTCDVFHDLYLKV